MSGRFGPEYSSCGNDTLNKFKNNTPVSDFICDKCNSEYELKSKNNAFTLKIVDGAYETMIRRINADNNPHFFFLNYTKNTFEVQNFLVIPKYYFIDDIIEQRNPLGKNARRAGWIGCNILLNNIPQLGKIFLGIIYLTPFEIF
ncbi:MAG: DpnI domain-containing protein [Smithella sp.]